MTGTVPFRILALVTALSWCTANAAQSIARAEPLASASPSATSPAAAPSFPRPASWPTIATSTASVERLGPGVLYQRWKLVTSSGPLELSIAIVDLRNPYVALGVAMQHGSIVGPGERLSSMANRLGAEVGINADYFDISDSGSPLNVVARESRVLHQPDRAAAFVVGGHDQIYMGPLNWSATIAGPSGGPIAVTRVNEWSVSVDLAMLTPEFGSTVAGGATEMVLDAQPNPGQYRVARIDKKLTDLEALTPGEIGVIARGSQADALARNFHRDDAVTLTTQIQPPLDLRLAAGGGPLLVQAGLPVEDPAPPAPEETDVRNPVTGAGTSKDGATLWLVVADGRAPARSIGLTRPQLASLFIALGADTAMAFDSGGSSEMVIRHRGETTTDVGGTPSDGRERSIADGLFVLNTAPTGQPVQLLLRPARLDSSVPPSGENLPSVLGGSSLVIHVDAVDANDQPVQIPQDQIVFSMDPTSFASMRPGGVLVAQKPGSLHVSAAAASARGDARITIVPGVDALQIVGAPNLPAGGRRRLAVKATTRSGDAIALDQAAVIWSAQGGATILPDGTVIAPQLPAKTLVTAKAGGATASIEVLSGEHSVMLQAVPVPGPGDGAWLYASQPDSIVGAVDAQRPRDRSAALRLAYDFSSVQGAPRAAYAQTTLALPGQPVALSIDVYGDKNGEWLRGGYRNADGNNESLTIARHVDWQGWKTLRVAIPPQMSWPITWTRLYVAEPSKTAQERGALWFRNLALIYPGP